MSDRISVQQCTADHPAGKHIICPHLEAEWDALTAKLHDRDGLAKVLEEADNQYTKKLITAMQGGPCLRSRNDVLADAVIRYATDTRPR